MEKKVRLLDTENILVTLKACLIRILSGLILIIPLGLAMWLRMNERPALALLFLIVSFLGNLWIFGYLARKLWGWK